MATEIPKPSIEVIKSFFPDIFKSENSFSQLFNDGKITGNIPHIINVTGPDRFSPLNFLSLDFQFKTVERGKVKQDIWHLSADFKINSEFQKSIISFNYYGSDNREESKQERSDRLVIALPSYGGKILIDTQNRRIYFGLREEDGRINPGTQASNYSKSIDFTNPILIKNEVLQGINGEYIISDIEIDEEHKLMAFHIQAKGFTENYEVRVPISLEPSISDTESPELPDLPLPDEPLPPPTFVDQFILANSLAIKEVEIGKAKFRIGFISDTKYLIFGDTIITYDMLRKIFDVFGTKAELNIESKSEELGLLVASFNELNQFNPVAGTSLFFALIKHLFISGIMKKRNLNELKKVK